MSEWKSYLNKKRHKMKLLIVTAGDFFLCIAASWEHFKLPSEVWEGPCLLSAPPWVRKAVVQLFSIISVLQWVGRYWLFTASFTVSCFSRSVPTSLLPSLSWGSWMNLTCQDLDGWAVSNSWEKEEVWISRKISPADKRILKEFERCCGCNNEWNI